MELWRAMRLNFRTVKVMLYWTIRRNTALQCWNNVATIRNNIATMLQRRVAVCAWLRIRVNVRIFNQSKIRPVAFLTFSLLSLSRHRKLPLECQVYERLLLFTNPESATGRSKAVGAGRRKQPRGKIEKCVEMSQWEYCTSLAYQCHNLKYEIAKSRSFITLTNSSPNSHKWVCSPATVVVE